jgi:hypothetical protein
MVSIPFALAAILSLTGLPRPLTLFPEPAQPGEVLRFVVAGAVLSVPDSTAEFLFRGEPGDTLVVRRSLVEAGRVWIETEAGGFVEAARVDRRPLPVLRTLPVGEEGMAAGRVLPDDYRPDDLVPVPDVRKAPGYVWRPMSLRVGALAAFAKLIEAAARDGVEIRILSAFRSAEYQRGLYARALDRDPLQTSSAPPGRSEHQLGTTVDVATPGVLSLSRDLADSPAGRWLDRHASEFGIGATFSQDRHAARGVAWEPWHLRWVGTAEERGW